VTKKVMDGDTGALYDVRPAAKWKKWIVRSDSIISCILSTQQSYPSKTCRK
jgi:hypothetical protein